MKDDYYWCRPRISEEKRLTLMTQIDDLRKVNEGRGAARRLINDTNWIFYLLGETIINWIRESKRLLARVGPNEPLFQLAQLLPFDTSTSLNKWTNERMPQQRDSRIIRLAIPLWPFILHRGHLILIRRFWFMGCPRNLFHDRIGLFIQPRGFRVDIRGFLGKFQQTN